MAVLVTGGAGYIGSHTCVELLNAGEDIIVIDNFYNSKPKAIEAIKEITGRDFRFYENDCCDREALDRIFRENFITEVIHFAGYKAVGESCVKPIMYYENNINSTLALIETMQKYGCKKLVFSSSATVYGIPDKVPVTEDFPLSAINPYGSTKLMIENMCRELYASDDQWSIILYVTSILSVHTRAVSLVKTPTAYRITLCPLSSAQPQEKWQRSAYSAMIIPLPTALA